MSKITEQFLKEQGFYDSGKKHANKIVWEKPVDTTPNSRLFRFTIGDYPLTNPNCGVLGLYTPLEECPAIPDDLVDKDQCTKEEEKRAANHTIQIGGDLINIAWYLDDTERFKRIVADLSYRRSNNITKEELEEMVKVVFRLDEPET